MTTPSAGRIDHRKQELQMTPNELPEIAAMSIDQLRTEMLGWLRGRPLQRWEWIRYRDERIKGPTFRADGTATAHGVSERVALEALVAGNRRLHTRRSASAKKAAATRAKRHARLVYQAAQRIKQGGAYGPASRCVICHKALGDAQSIQRGIGSDCWQDVLTILTEADELAHEQR